MAAQRRLEARSPAEVEEARLRQLRLMAERQAAEMEQIRMTGEDTLLLREQMSRLEEAQAIEQECQLREARIRHFGLERLREVYTRAAHEEMSRRVELAHGALGEIAANRGLPQHIRDQASLHRTRMTEIQAGHIRTNQQWFLEEQHRLAEMIAQGIDEDDLGDYPWTALGTWRDRVEAERAALQRDVRHPNHLRQDLAQTERTLTHLDTLERNLRDRNTDYTDREERVALAILQRQRQVYPDGPTLLKGTRFQHLPPP
jgi:hypothetical protein